MEAVALAVAAAAAVALATVEDAEVAAAVVALATVEDVEVAVDVVALAIAVDPAVDPEEDSRARRPPFEESLRPERSVSGRRMTHLSRRQAEAKQEDRLVRQSAAHDGSEGSNGTFVGYVGCRRRISTIPCGSVGFAF